MPFVQRLHSRIEWTKAQRKLLQIKGMIRQLRLNCAWKHEAFCLIFLRCWFLLVYWFPVEKKNKKLGVIQFTKTKEKRWLGDYKLQGRGGWMEVGAGGWVEGTLIVSTI